MTDEEALDFYGADAAEWLRRWDAGRGVWSVEMGGLGPGYEQCIQVVASEIIRHMLEEGYDFSIKEMWDHQREAIERFGHESEVIKKLGGITGAQWGAAFNLALQIYRKGPAKCFTDHRIKDRTIQVRKDFP